VAEKSFPILRGSAEMDPAPLMRPVQFRFPAALERPAPRLHAGLMIASLLILTTAAMAIWRGQKLG
jgi:hypothetical protein